MAARDEAVKKRGQSWDKRIRRENVRQGEDHGPPAAVNAPLDGNQCSGDDDDTGNDQDRHGQREPETLRDLGNFLEEIGPFDFLLRRTPLDVVGEEVRKNGLTERNGQATKEEEAVANVRCRSEFSPRRTEDSQEGNPGKIPK